MRNTVFTLTSILALGAVAAYAQPAADEEAAQDQAEAADEENTDEIADMLNSQQQLQQTFTLRREVNGEIVETEKRTVTYSRDDPYRETEAGKSAAEEVLEAFDRDLLTRTEAFEEAKLDFTVADVDRDEKITIDEYIVLVRSWTDNQKRAAAAPNESIKRQRKYDAFLQEISPDDANLPSDENVRMKFAFMAGAEGALSRRDYIREYMLDFDAMDANKDMLLKGEELQRFRAVIRGETVTPSVDQAGDNSEM